MNKISLFNKIKTIGYRKILIISITTILIGIGLFNYHSTTYYSCKVELENSNANSDLFRATISVKKYLGGRYTLNQYKLSECFYTTKEDLFERDRVYCNNQSKDEKQEEYLTFDIVNGNIEMLQARVYGNFMAYPNIHNVVNECTKINRSVD